MSEMKQGEETIDYAEVWLRPRYGWLRHPDVADYEDVLRFASTHIDAEFGWTLDWTLKFEKEEEPSP